MTKIKFHSIILLTILLSFGRDLESLPPIIAPLLGTAWDAINPSSVQNRIKDLAKEIENIKTHLQKLEHSVIFGDDKKCQIMVDICKLHGYRF